MKIMRTKVNPVICLFLLFILTGCQAEILEPKTSNITGMPLNEKEQDSIEYLVRINHQ